MRLIIFLFTLLTVLSSWSADFSVCEQHEKLNLDNITRLQNELEREHRAAYKLSGGGSKSKFTDNRKNTFLALYKVCIEGKFDVSDLSKMTNQSLKRLHNVLYAVHLYSKSPIILPALKLVVTEQIVRTPENKQAITDLIRNYLISRDFDGARAVIASYPQFKFDAVPSVIGDEVKARDLLKVAGTSNTFVREKFEFKTGGELIVITAPNCGFSKKFISWLDTKPGLKQRIIKNSHWVIPQAAELNIEKTRQVNALYNPINLYYIDKQSDWPEIGSWGMPRFYFYNNGKLVNTIIGVGHEEDEFDAALSDIGL